eukprot:SAG11_NODE_432_length_9520_cov_102.527863_2_plen_100_part_00
MGARCSLAWNRVEMSTNRTERFGGTKRQFQLPHHVGRPYHASCPTLILPSEQGCVLQNQFDHLLMVHDSEVRLRTRIMKPMDCPPTRSGKPPTVADLLG